MLGVATYIFANGKFAHISVIFNNIFSNKFKMLHNGFSIDLKINELKINKKVAIMIIPNSGEATKFETMNVKDIVLKFNIIIGIITILADIVRLILCAIFIIKLPFILLHIFLFILR